MTGDSNGLDVITRCWSQAEAIDYYPALSNAAILDIVEKVLSQVQFYCLVVSDLAVILKSISYGFQ